MKRVAEYHSMRERKTKREEHTSLCIGVCSFKDVTASFSLSLSIHIMVVSLLLSCSWSLWRPSV